MKNRMKFIGFLLILLVACFATNASALSLGGLIDTSGGATLLSDNSAEFLINVDGSVGATGAPTVTTGDILVTMVGINSIETSGSTTIGSGTVYNELTAVTAIKIASESALFTNTQGVDLSYYTAAPLGAGDAAYLDWSTGSILGGAYTFNTGGAGLTNDDKTFGLVFEDSSNDYTRNQDIQTGLDSASNGLLRLALGLDSAEGDYLNVIAPLDLGQLVGLPFSTAIDSTNISLDASIIAQYWPGLVFATNITGGNGGFSTPTDGSGWPIFDNLDFTVTASAIPEPGTVLLLGMGLLGLAGLGRKRFTK